tara:strand:+ start:3678 stop:4250 length:573 start_codon:yes stop_codon:yes gene_type:complete
MFKQQFFPTNIYEKDIKIDNQSLANNIINWSKQEKGLVKTNVNGWHSPDNLNTKPEYQELIDQLYIMQEEIYKEEFIDRKPKLGNMWANVNYPGSWNRPHIHSNSLYSGVYYIKTQPESGNLVVYDPRPQFMKPTLKNEELPLDLWKEAQYRPVEGRLIMFNSWLLHGVEINKSNDTRISISFNFLQEGF